MENLTPESSVLLEDAMKHNAGDQVQRPRGPLSDFVDELELRILDLNDKLYIEESRTMEGAINNEAFSSSGLEIQMMFDILDENSQPVCKLAKCSPQDNRLDYILANNAGHAVLSLTRSGCLIHSFAVTGAGLLAFNQVVNPCGYTLEDPYKKLLQIRTRWIPFLTFLLFIPRLPASMKLVNLDGSSTGTVTYLKTGGTSSLCIQFIRGLDRKAKYMILAACLLPLSAYFSEPGRTRTSIWLGISYLFILIGIGVVAWSVYELTTIQLWSI